MSNLGLDPQRKLTTFVAAVTNGFKDIHKLRVLGFIVLSDRVA